MINIQRSTLKENSTTIQCLAAWLTQQCGGFWIKPKAANKQHSSLTELYRNALVHDTLTSAGGIKKLPPRCLPTSGDHLYGKYFAAGQRLGSGKACIYSASEKMRQETLTERRKNEFNVFMLGFVLRW